MIQAIVQAGTAQLAIDNFSGLFNSNTTQGEISLIVDSALGGCTTPCPDSKITLLLRITRTGSSGTGSSAPRSKEFRLENLFLGFLLLFLLYPRRGHFS
jgi:hypothetical protein